jgi:hypothetical protein
VANEIKMNPQIARDVIPEMKIDLGVPDDRIKAAIREDSSRQRRKDSH